MRGPDHYPGQVFDEAATFGKRHVATLPHVYPWESQVAQYYAEGCQPPESGEGLTYFAGPVEGGHVDCLLFWANRKIVGILNHYPFTSAWEEKGNVNVWVRRPNQRQGIGTTLWTEAVRRWGVSLDQQRFTQAGAAFANKIEESQT